MLFAILITTSIIFLVCQLSVWYKKGSEAHPAVVLHLLLLLCSIGVTMDSRDQNKEISRQKVLLSNTLKAHERSLGALEVLKASEKDLKIQVKDLNTQVFNAENTAAFLKDDLKAAQGKLEAIKKIMNQEKEQVNEEIQAN